MISFYTHWKHQKIRDFMILLGGIKNSLEWNGLTVTSKSWITDFKMGENDRIATLDSIFGKK